MQCNACVEICPVGIEQAPIINQLRRRLLEDGELDAGLQSDVADDPQVGQLLRRAPPQPRQWTQSSTSRSRTHARSRSTCSGSSATTRRSTRARSASRRALARVFHEAGLDFGILYDGEQNAGNDVRRAGEEGLFEMLAEANMELLAGCEFERIVTSDPHSLNTLVNEYPQLRRAVAGAAPHRAAARAARAGAAGHGGAARLPRHLPRPLLSRPPQWRYDAPRRLLELLGCELVEMPRNRENSFCCGAGGGQIWISEQGGDERPSENRIREALEPQTSSGSSSPARRT